MDRNLQKLCEERAFGKPIIIPKFFLHAQKDEIKSARYGINIYGDMLYVRIKTKGRKDNTVRKATTEDLQVFEHAYAKFLHEQQAQNQTLESLPGYTTALGFTFRDRGVTTVDELVAYRGPFPTAEMKRLWHTAAYISRGLEAYNPPVFKDDQEVQYAQEIRYPEAPVVRTSGGDYDRNNGVATPFGHTPGNQGGNQPVQFAGIPDQQTQILGVNLSEEGEIQGTYGYQA